MTRHSRDQELNAEGPPGSAEIQAGFIVRYAAVGAEKTSWPRWQGMVMSAASYEAAGSVVRGALDIERPGSGDEVQGLDLIRRCRAGGDAFNASGHRDTGRDQLILEIVAPWGSQ